jgi:hypothetical protein
MKLKLELVVFKLHVRPKRSTYVMTAAMTVTLTIKDHGLITQEPIQSPDLSVKVVSAKSFV